MYRLATTGLLVRTQLNKFEVLLLTEDQVREFEMKFQEKKFSIQEPLFQAWLDLKIATVPTEAQSIDQSIDQITYGQQYSTSGTKA